MKLPNLSNSMGVARLRHIQSIRESGERRNPDTFVRHFLPLLERWSVAWLGQKQLAKLRAAPFYYYLVARTRYYDQLFLDAIAQGVRQIINVGCGSDTRALRFEQVLSQHDVRVLECDQREAIDAKIHVVKGLRRFQHIDYLALDLNDEMWPEFELRLQHSAGAPTLVLIEGVSPYVNDNAFGKFLRLFPSLLASGCHIAYDYKLRGADDGFGRADRTYSPFRLTDCEDDVAEYHEERGYRLEHMELSSALSERLLPSLVKAASPLFHEDVLIQLSIR